MRKTNEAARNDALKVLDCNKVREANGEARHDPCRGCGAEAAVTSPIGCILNRQALVDPVG